MQEDEVLFEKIDEYHMKLDTTSVTLTQATSHNITVLNENLLEAKSKNLKLKDELVSLEDEMKKRRKVDDNLVLIKENIMKQQEQLHDLQVECFIEVQKMVKKV